MPLFVAATLRDTTYTVAAAVTGPNRDPVSNFDLYVLTDDAELKPVNQTYRLYLNLFLTSLLHLNTVDIMFCCQFEMTLV